MIIDARVNGKKFESYDAKILTYDIGACSFSHGHVKPSDSMIPVKLKPKIGLRTISITLDFEGEGIRDIEKKIKKLTKELHQGAEITLPDGYIYSTVYKSATTPKEKAPWIYQVKFSLSGYRHGPLKEKTLSATGTVFADGDLETPAIIEFVPTGTTAQVFGISLTDLTANQKIVIDGMKKTIMQGTTNIFANSDMTSFPSLEPGENAVSISGTSSVKISYYPIFL